MHQSDLRHISGQFKRHMHLWCQYFLKRKTKIMTFCTISSMSCHVLRTLVILFLVDFCAIAGAGIHGHSDSHNEVIEHELAPRTRKTALPKEPKFFDEFDRK